MRNYEFTSSSTRTKRRRPQAWKSLSTAFADAGVEITKQEDMGVKISPILSRSRKRTLRYFELKAEPSSIKGLNRPFAQPAISSSCLSIKKNKRSCIVLERDVWQMT
jgi:small subunit ribosomal protein S6